MTGEFDKTKTSKEHEGGMLGSNKKSDKLCKSKLYKRAASKEKWGEKQLLESINYRYYSNGWIIELNKVKWNKDW